MPTNSETRDIVERYHRTIFNFFLNKSCNVSEDLTQETFLRYFERQRSGTPVSNERGYIFAIARNVLIDHYRRFTGRDEISLEESVAALSSSPSSVASHHRRSALLAQHLRALPISMQLVLEMHYWNGLTTAEISTALEIKEATVKTRLQNGRKKLLSLHKKSEIGHQKTFSQLDENAIASWLSEAKQYILAHEP